MPTKAEVLEKFEQDEKIRAEREEGESLQRFIEACNARPTEEEQRAQWAEESKRDRLHDNIRALAAWLVAVGAQTPGVHVDEYKTAQRARMSAQADGRSFQETQARESEQSAIERVFEVLVRSTTAATRSLNHETSTEALLSYNETAQWFAKRLEGGISDQDAAFVIEALESRHPRCR